MTQDQAEAIRRRERARVAVVEALAAAEEASAALAAAGPDQWLRALLVVASRGAELRRAMDALGEAYAVAAGLPPELGRVGGG